MTAVAPTEIISLPTGGGAVRSIAESFSPNLHTGTGNLQVSIALPPGRGLRPDLNLEYSTGSGNGAFGLGWRLRLQTISRRTARGVPRYDGDDVFTLSALEDLVPVASSGLTTRYRPRVEGTFARIERHGAIGTEWWEVATKDGLVSRYGARSGGGAVTPDDEALVRDPLDTTRVFAWSLTETVDPFGNRVEYGYTLDAPADAEAHAAALAAGHCFNRRLPLLVQYADVADGAGVRFVVSVHFEYEDRPDPFSDYRAGFELRTTRRCKRIVVATHADAATAQGVRAYEFVYQDEIDELDVPANGASLLSKILVGSFADGVVPEQPASEPASAAAGVLVRPVRSAASTLPSRRRPRPAARSPRFTGARARGCDRGRPP